MSRTVVLAIAGLLIIPPAGLLARLADERAPVATLGTVAYRVRDMPAMGAFYTPAFGARFREVDTRQHGGPVENEPERDGDRVHAAVRDPDGNTLELHGPK